MPMPWFRFYHEALDDPKVQTLPPHTFMMWVNLLCIAHRTDRDGALPDVADLAFRLRLGVERVTELLGKLETVGLIDRDADGTRVMHNWTGRQFISDDATARSRNWRREQRERRAQEAAAAREGATLHETLHATAGATAGATAQDTDSDSEQTQNRAEQSTATGVAVARDRAPQRHAKLHLHVVPNPNGGKATIDVTAAPEPAAAPPRRSRAKAGAAPCPSVDELVESVGEWADRKGVARATVESIAERLANYCAAGKGDGKPVVYADYSRALQNWINRDLERGGTSPTPPRGGGRGGRLTNDEAVQEAIRRRRERDGHAAPSGDDDDAIEVAFRVRRG